MIILEDEKMANTKKCLVGATVVSADCCTDCVLDHMRAAVLTKKEEEILARFEMADRDFTFAKAEFLYCLEAIDRYSNVLFFGKDLCTLRTLINELEILSLSLPKTNCLPF